MSEEVYWSGFFLTVIGCWVTSKNPAHVIFGFIAALLWPLAAFLKLTMGIFLSGIHQDNQILNLKASIDTLQRRILFLEKKRHEQLNSMHCPTSTGSDQHISHDQFRSVSSGL
jgi:hypothetical protein